MRMANDVRDDRATDHVQLVGGKRLAIQENRQNEQSAVHEMRTASVLPAGRGGHQDPLSFLAAIASRTTPQRPWSSDGERKRSPAAGFTCGRLVKALVFAYGGRTFYRFGSRTSEHLDGIIGTVGRVSSSGTVDAGGVPTESDVPRQRVVPEALY